MYSDGIWKRNVRNILEQVIEGDEKPVSIFKFNEKWGFLSRYLVITDKRVVQYHPHRYFNRRVSIPYHRIESVKLEKGYFYSSIYIKIRQYGDEHGDIRIRDLVNNKGERASVHIRRELRKSNSNDLDTYSNNLELLQILKTRLAKGEISRKEYFELLNDLELAEVVFCPSCGQKNGKEATFCLSCGITIGEKSLKEFI